ncbi:uncharacterized protein LOC114315864 isoform X1 [Camellia sinensis]|uniref:uncharacterized protein LOC114315864 isoform X1 n=1 Tax=Camellia sinensis TaxID=4442 RepID=UPI001036AF96|nr:uncharacterized protein LOC114315864 isoform X1 [Camellia sinensis]XP_028118281.1 uncharacterized protein LOC114315864 isoform X1 [Camellia sinensis]
MEQHTLLRLGTPQRHRHRHTKGTLHSQQGIHTRHHHSQDIKVTSIKGTLLHHHPLNPSLTSCTIVSITNTKIRAVVPHSSKAGHSTSTQCLLYALEPDGFNIWYGTKVHSLKHQLLRSMVDTCSSLAALCCCCLMEECFY